MISSESFTPDWIKSHRQNRKYARINPRIIEKMNYTLPC